MKIVNIVDINLIKLFLTKYYIAKSIDYLFYDTHHQSIQEIIKENNPDALLVQCEYSDFSARDFMQEIRTFSMIPLFVFNFDDNQDATEKLYSYFSSVDNVTILNKNNVNSIQNLFLSGESSEPSKPNLEVPIDEEKKTILYVDDSHTMHRFVRKALADSSFNIVQAYNGQEAFDLYNIYMPDLVITDIEMPVMNGFELCRQIKEDNKGRFIPVVVLSSLGAEPDKDTAFNCGADDYLVKPVTKEALTDKIDEYFEVLDRNKRNKILVADDSKVVNEMVTHALKKNNLNVITAYDGQEAFDLAHEHQPEIIITDIEMPGMTGYELIEKIKTGGDLPNTSFIIMSNLSQQSNIQRGKMLGINKYFTKPFDVEKMVLVVEQLLLEKYNVYKKEYEYMLSTITALVSALEARDTYTKGHTMRVSEYSLKLGRFMGLSQRELDDLEIAANLHDIGKIGVRDDVLLKPGKLTDEEYAQIQEHAVIGAEILKPIKSLSHIIPLILLHHERWDGKGYPTMVSGEEIPLGARIIAVADTFDAITSDRPYRKGLPVEKALSIIEECLGSQFCPVCGKEFLKMMHSE